MMAVLLIMPCQPLELQKQGRRFFSTLIDVSRNDSVRTTNMTILLGSLVHIARQVRIR